MYRSYYRPSMKRSTAPRRPADPVQVWDWETAWAAAAYANRINDGYFKDGVWEVNHDAGTQTRVKEPNRDVMKLALRDQTLITHQVRDLRRQARDWLGKNLVLRALKGQLNDFEQTVSRVCSIEDFDSGDRLELAVLASQISSYITNSRVEQVMSRVDHSAGHLAPVGNKVDVTIEVVRSVYSQNYGVYFLTGITDSAQAVFFSYREAVPAGTKMRVRGSVKAHRADSTQLTRVRVVQ